MALILLLANIANDTDVQFFWLLVAFDIADEDADAELLNERVDKHAVQNASCKMPRAELMLLRSQS